MSENSPKRLPKSEDLGLIKEHTSLVKNLIKWGVVTAITFLPNVKPVAAQMQMPTTSYENQVTPPLLINQNSMFVSKNKEKGIQLHEAKILQSLQQNLNDARKNLNAAIKRRNEFDKKFGHIIGVGYEEQRIKLSNSIVRAQARHDALEAELRDLRRTFLSY